MSFLNGVKYSYDSSWCAKIQTFFGAAPLAIVKKRYLRFGASFTGGGSKPGLHTARQDAPLPDEQ
ncbi:MAG: hypothetical protein MSS47_01845, partial [Bacteroidales bacterium]|nr:hypothetical protein [Bacteroidales bacterium]